MELWMSALLFLFGLGILIRGSDFFVGSAAFIAKRFGVSELIIGLTLVSMGTSFPELGASVYASATGRGGIAVGNVVGSNIANIALVLGVCLLLRHIKVKRTMLTRDGIIMLGVTMLFTIFVYQGVQRWEGFILIALFAFYLIFLYRQNRNEKRDEALAIETAQPEGEGVDQEQTCEENPQEETAKGKGLGSEVFKLTAGCLGVIVGAWLMVEMAVNIATAFEISQTVIGSTLVAFGTSVPELAVSMVAILKRYEQISIGNIIGSNIFNILLVIGASAMVNPLSAESQTGENLLFFTNIPIMLLVAAILLLFMAVRNRLERWEGGVFVAIYAIFIIMNYW